MKKLFTILAAFLLTASVFAQSTEKMSYQAVIRNSSDALVTDTQIGLQTSILQGSSEGSPVYVETQTPTTNANGLVSIEIGNGSVVNGDFSTIDWANGPYYIKTETDPAGSTDYTITGTSQLLSVPYALHAKTAKNGITTAQADAITTNTAKVGYSDALVSANTDVAANTAKLGITTAQADAITANTAKVSYPAADATKLDGIAAGAEVNVQSDWNQSTTTADDYIKNKPTIPAAADGSETKVTAGTNVTVTGSGTTASPYVVNSTAGTHYLGEEYLDGIIFYLYTDNTGTQKGLIVSKTESTGTWSGSTLVGADRTEDGAYNTNLMPAGSTAKTWVTGLGADWYLPSIDELSLLWHNRYHVNKTARAINSTLLSTTGTYWSSTEYNPTYAFNFFFGNGYPYYNYKTNTYSVRAVRAF